MSAVLLSGMMGSTMSKKGYYPTPHQRIITAAKENKGMRLSPDEVYSLSRDGAIQKCAGNDDFEQSVEKIEKEESPAVEPIFIDDYNRNSYEVTPCKICGNRPMRNNCGPEYQGIMCTGCDQRVDGDEKFAECNKTNEFLVSAIDKWNTDNV